MATKRHKPKEIVTMLRQVQVLVGQGMTRVDAIREVRITEQTYYRSLSAMRSIACRSMGVSSMEGWEPSN